MLLAAARRSQLSDDKLQRAVSRCEPIRPTARIGSARIGSLADFLAFDSVTVGRLLCHEPYTAVHSLAKDPPATDTPRRFAMCTAASCHIRPIKFVLRPSSSAHLLPAADFRRPQATEIVSCAKRTVYFYEPNSQFAPQCLTCAEKLPGTCSSAVLSTVQNQTVN